VSKVPLNSDQPTYHVVVEFSVQFLFACHNEQHMREQVPPVLHHGLGLTWTMTDGGDRRLVVG